MDLPKTYHCDKSFRVISVVPTAGTTRKPIQVSLGNHVVGGAMPHPDIQHAETSLLGVCKRIACEMPSIDSALLEEFLQFCAVINEEKFKHCIIQPEEDLSLKTFLDTTDYTEKRKAKLTRAYEEYLTPLLRHLAVLSFSKREPYLKYNPARGIYSRSDYIKAYIGPYTQNIGRKMFKGSMFIKNIPVEDRAKFLFDKYNIPGLKLSSNDFTSYEATFVQQIMRIELQFYEFCLQLLPEQQYLMQIFMRTKQGISTMTFKNFVARLRAKRYSGEMDTSSMNSYFNYVLIMFLLFKSMEHTKNPKKAIVSVANVRSFLSKVVEPTLEGDDSLIAHFKKLNETILTRLGAIAKLETHDSAFDASFCGLLFDPVALDLIYNPFKFLMKFGYTSDRYLHSNNKTKLALIRAKALSFLFVFKACPIISPYCQKMLTLTTSVGPMKLERALAKLRREKGFERMVHCDSSTVVKTTEIKMETRFLMERTFQCPVEIQLSLENYIKTIDKIQPFDCPILYDYFTPDQRHYYETYAHTMELRQDMAFM